MDAPSGVNPVTEAAEVDTVQKSAEEGEDGETEAGKRKRDSDLGSVSGVKRQRKQRAHRPSSSEPVSDDQAKEGDQESLISQEPTILYLLPAPSVAEAEAQPQSEPINADKVSVSEDNAAQHIPSVIYLGAPPTSTPTIQTPTPTPPISPTSAEVPTVDPTSEPVIESESTADVQTLLQNVVLEEVLIADLPEESTHSEASHTQLLFEEEVEAEVEDEDSVHSDAQQDIAGTSGLIGKADIVRNFVREATPVAWEDTHRGEEWTKSWNDPEL